MLELILLMIELLVSAFDVDMSYLVVRFKTLVEPNWGNLERFLSGFYQAGLSK